MGRLFFILRKIILTLTILELLLIPFARINNQLSLFSPSYANANDVCNYFKKDTRRQKCLADYQQKCLALSGKEKSVCIKETVCKHSDPEENLDVEGAHLCNRAGCSQESTKEERQQCLKETTSDTVSKLLSDEELGGLLKKEEIANYTLLGVNLVMMIWSFAYQDKSNCRIASDIFFNFLGVSQLAHESFDLWRTDKKFQSLYEEYKEKLSKSDVALTESQAPVEGLGSMQIDFFLYFIQKEIIEYQSLKLADNANWHAMTLLTLGNIFALLELTTSQEGGMGCFIDKNKTVWGKHLKNKPPTKKTNDILDNTRKNPNSTDEFEAAEVDLVPKREKDTPQRTQENQDYSSDEIDELDPDYDELDQNHRYSDQEYDELEYDEPEFDDTPPPRRTQETETDTAELKEDPKTKNQDSQTQQPVEPDSTQDPPPQQGQQFQQNEQAPVTPPGNSGPQRFDDNGPVVDSRGRPTDLDARIRQQAINEQINFGYRQKQMGILEERANQLARREGDFQDELASLKAQQRQLQQDKDDIRDPIQALAREKAKLNEARDALINRHREMKNSFMLKQADLELKIEQAADELADIRAHPEKYANTSEQQVKRLKELQLKHDKEKTELAFDLRRAEESVQAEKSKIGALEKQLEEAQELQVEQTRLNAIELEKRQSAFDRQVQKLQREIKLKEETLSELDEIHHKDLQAERQRGIKEGAGQARVKQHGEEFDRVTERQRLRSEELDRKAKELEEERSSLRDVLIEQERLKKRLRDQQMMEFDLEDANRRIKRLEEVEKEAEKLRNEKRVLQGQLLARPAFQDVSSSALAPSSPASAQPVNPPSPVISPRSDPQVIIESAGRRPPSDTDFTPVPPPQPRTKTFSDQRLAEAARKHSNNQATAANIKKADSQLDTELSERLPDFNLENQEAMANKMASLKKARRNIKPEVTSENIEEKLKIFQTTLTSTKHKTDAINAENDILLNLKKTKDQLKVQSLIKKLKEVGNNPPRKQAIINKIKEFLKITPGQSSVIRNSILPYVAKIFFPKLAIASDDHSFQYQAKFKADGMFIAFGILAIAGALSTALPFISPNIIETLRGFRANAAGRLLTGLFEAVVVAYKMTLIAEKKEVLRNRLKKLVGLVCSMDQKSPEESTINNKLEAIASNDETFKLPPGMKFDLTPFKKDKDITKILACPVIEATTYTLPKYFQERLKVLPYKSLFSNAMDPKAYAKSRIFRQNICMDKNMRPDPYCSCLDNNTCLKINDYINSKIPKTFLGDKNFMYLLKSTQSRIKGKAYPIEEQDKVVRSIISLNKKTRKFHENIEKKSKLPSRKKLLSHIMKKVGSKVFKTQSKATFIKNVIKGEEKEEMRIKELIYKPKVEAKKPQKVFKVKTIIKTQKSIWDIVSQRYLKVYYYDLKSESPR